MIREACHVMGQALREVLRTILRWIESLIGVISAFVRSGMAEKVLKSRMSEVRPLMSLPEAALPSPGLSPPYHQKSRQSGPVIAAASVGQFCRGPMSRNSRCTPRRTSIARSRLAAIRADAYETL
ncbi:hypothetical protein X771_26485 [Mesorhizobium sp. LSJC277A00]|nr:hypothetical protein X771_26485 [Mesorhizobium sp. LSJC277A00]ESZ23952.1 hypothetical protein X733_32660 [Mesorhizobium sp. L2C067A000]